MPGVCLLVVYKPQVYRPDNQSFPNQLADTKTCGQQTTITRKNPTAR
jgi:hypothetical protein